MEAEQKIFGNVIYTYTRKQAIADGYQIKLEGAHAEIARQAGWKYPVYLTSGVWELIEQAVASERHCNDFNGVLWDIVWMARSGKDISQDTRVFRECQIICVNDFGYYSSGHPIAIEDGELIQRLAPVSGGHCPFFLNIFQG